MVQTRNILIVDDNAAHRTLIKRAIQRGEGMLGCRLTIFESAALGAAGNQLKELAAGGHRLDIVLLDLNLGQDRGTELIADIRGYDEHARSSVLILSTSSLESDIRDAYRAGANCYLTKSEDILAFSRELAAALTFFLCSAGR